MAFGCFGIFKPLLLSNTLVRVYACIHACIYVAFMHVYKYMDLNLLYYYYDYIFVIV